MGDAADRAAVWMEAGGTLDQLIALTGLSAGYAGHDTGPMHVAAATGTPVLAVFGGGHWPRFVPRAVPSVSLTVGVPCAGCGWACSFETSHCVKALPVDEVLRAVEDLEAGRVTGRFVRSLAPTPELLNVMVGEVSRFAQKQLRDASDLSRRVRDLAPERLAPLQADRDEQARLAARLTDELSARDAAAAELRRELDRGSDEAAGIAAPLHQRAGGRRAAPPGGGAPVPPPRGRAAGREPCRRAGEAGGRGGGRGGVGDGRG